MTSTSATAMQTGLHALQGALTSMPTKRQTSPGLAGTLKPQIDCVAQAVLSFSFCRTDKATVGRRCGLCPLPALRQMQSQTGHEALGILEGTDVLLLFRTAKASHEKASRRHCDANDLGKTC